MTDQLPLFHQAFYRRERRSVPLARDFTRRVLTEWDMDTRADDVLLCVSELATNALLHGVPPGRGYRLHLYLERPGPTHILRVELHDSGDGTPARREPTGETGRGLLLVDALADRWGVGERDPGKIVWCEFTGV
ncbi:ATP-binding protein [Streptomyces lateritius]|uniref:ATP-binding protein n=1 Tax=Streptomyces lateritius TaxID=67313 RepID=UPI001671B2EE|nr:ATP-binding protein [Streptomyces lateritius]GGU00638.1 ATP-binding protein [Streptomyces lateritius]